MLTMSPVRLPSRFAGGVFIIAATFAPGPSVVRLAPRQGLIYTETVVNDRGQLAAGPSADTTVSAEQFEGDNERFDVRYLSPSPSRGGDSLSRRYGIVVGLYGLRKRGSWVLTVVDTARRQYFAYDQDSAMRVVFRKGPEAQVQPGDTAFATRVKPDTIIDGRHTEHWRITSHATMRMKIVGDFSSSTTSDTYISTEMTDDLRFVGPGGGQQALFGGEAYARKQEAARAQLPQGLEVLTITQSVVGGGPISRTFVKTRRLSDIRYADIPAEVFAVPAGYARVAPPTDPPSGSSRARSN